MFGRSSRGLRAAASPGSGGVAADKMSYRGGRIAHVQATTEQMGLFEEPTRLFVCTPSRLGSYEDCPRRYRYTYIDRPTPQRGPPWAHNSLGASVHTALRAWFDLAPA